MKMVNSLSHVMLVSSVTMLLILVFLLKSGVTIYLLTDQKTMIVPSLGMTLSLVITMNY